MMPKHMHVAPAAAFDLCSVCGAYAELDSLESIICSACAADAATDTDPDALATIESLACHASYRAESARGQRIAAILAEQADLDREIDALEARYWRTYGMRPDAADSYRVLCDAYQTLDTELAELTPAVSGGPIYLA